ncbi:GNAT family N-acetyltransferase [Paenibacillus tarimensis]
MFSYTLTEQTEMKLLEPDHAYSLYRLTMQNRPFLQNWFKWVRRVHTEHDTHAFINDLDRLRRLGDAFAYGVFYEDRLCGVAELREVNSPDSCGRIGFWLSEDEHGKGLMTRACGALTDYAFETCGLNRVEMRASTDNKRGRLVPERLGYSLEGIARQAKKHDHRFVDLAIYGLLAEEWAEMDRMSRYVGF